MTHGALMPSAALPPLAVFGFLTWTWSPSWLLAEEAGAGAPKPHATPAAPDSRVATTTRTTLLRCTGRNPTDGPSREAPSCSGTFGAVAGTMGRRTCLKAAGGIGLLALAPAARVRALMVAAPGPGQAGRFLTAHELDTLRAVAGRLVPGPPDDPDPGAVEAGAPEAIDLLLASFTLDPPLIHAGGPFSNLAGAAHDDFADFIPLDRLSELGWRIRLEGSQGKPE